MFLGGYLTPIVSSEDWSRTYGIELKEDNCKRCGHVLCIDKPFATKDVRGFVSGPCECGNEKTPFTFIFKDELPGIPKAELSSQNFC